MSKVKEDKSRVIVEIDGKQAINQLGKLEMEAKQLAIDLKDMKRGTKDYIATNKELKSVKANIEAVRKELGLAGMTMTQLTRYQRDLRKEMGNTATYGTQKYKELQHQYKAVTGEITKQRKELAGTAGFFSDIKKELKSFAVLAVGALGITELFAGIQNLISGSAELSDAYADVQKTTGLTKTEVEQLNQELKKMDTRTARSELLGLAAEAGKLGITGRKDILDFVEGADKINVALGEDLGEGAITSIGKLNELFGIREIYGYGDAMLKAGSAINELGASSTAQESYIVGFTARLGGAAKQAKITMTDIMGLGATLDSLGQQEETASTAVGMFLVDMFKDTSTYAKIAGVEVGEFTKLLNTDANEALIKVLEGLNGNNEGFTTMVTKLAEVGVEGSRGTQIISALAGNTKMLREQQDIANKSFTEGTSILDEFNTKNQNFAGSLEKIQKWMTGFFVNGEIMQGLNAFVSLWAKWVTIPVSEKLEDERMALNSMMIQITDVNTTNEQRIKLINELKKQYPKHLENINAETVTNGQLAKSIRQINDEMINKIILQKQDEKIAEQNADVAGKRMLVMQKEDELIKEMLKVSEKFNTGVMAAGTLEEKATNLATVVGLLSTNQEGRDGKLIGPTAKLIELLADYKTQSEQLIDVEGKNNLMLEEREKLIDRLGIKMEEIKPQTIDPDGTPTVDPVAPSDPKDAEKAKKELEKRLEAYEDYLIKIRDLQRDFEIAGEGAQEADLLKVEYEYEALEEALKQHLQNKTITQQEYDIQLRELQAMELAEHTRINAEYATKAEEDRKAGQQKIIEATTEEKELAIMKTNQLYDELLAIAQLYGLETVSIEEARRLALEGVQKKFDKKEIEEATKIAEAKQMIAQGLSASIGAVIDFIGNKQGELTTFQKILTVAGIAIDTAASLGKIIPLAAEAASGTGPAAPFVFAGYIAAMAGTVLGAAAKAKNALSDANTPEWDSSGDDQPNTGRSRPPQTKKKSFYFGGHTGDEDLGTGDRYGKFAGWVHQNEYVMSEAVMQTPFIANLMPAIEAVRQDRENGYGGGSGASGALGFDTRSLERKLDVLIAETRSAKDKKVVLVNSELEEFQEEVNQVKMRYSA